MISWAGWKYFRSSRPLVGVRGGPGFHGTKASARWGAVLSTLALLWCDAALAGEPKVLLLRGWFGVFSTGLDGLGRDLKAKGINAEVTGHLYWGPAVGEILRERAAGKTDPIVLIGHSQGANNVIDMARALEEHGIAVALVVTLAPFLQGKVPANVVHAINYYQSPGWGMAVSTEPGFHGKLSNVDVGNDWGITHVNIDKDSRIHAEIEREILALAQTTPGEDPAGRKPAVAGPSSRSAEKKSPKRANSSAKEPGTPTSAPR
jgi:hypothetical protein